MIRAVVIAAALALSGCASVSAVKDSRPIYSAESDKSADVVAACVADKWQERDPRTSSMQTPEGHRVTIKAFGMNDAVTAILDARTAGVGSLVDVRSALWSERVSADYLNDVRSCQ